MGKSAQRQAGKRADKKPKNKRNGRRGRVRAAPHRRGAEPDALPARRLDGDAQALPLPSLGCWLWTRTGSEQRVLSLTSDDVLPDGFSVGKGDIVFYGVRALGRMEYLWGRDAEAFRPERWLDDNGEFQQESPFKFTAFQAGPRICLGKEFAYRQMKVLAAVLLRFFVFRLRDEAASVSYRATITLLIEDGLHLTSWVPRLLSDRWVPRLLCGVPRQPKW
ncbi:cytochrome P450 704C1-like [Panicum virgatum]|uniref:cytochrome P450 704C1-like n=1 Tax=Panicum virgatum TaxID=38727 RepID=UPI0019D4FDCB|nr:cytochrome P450 704C1-like [Panicum virgatum]